MKRVWPDRRLLELLGIDVPIVQAPMAGANRSEMAIAVSNAGGLGSIPCALLDTDAIESECAQFRAQSSRPFNLNFFCHAPPVADAAVDADWRATLASYYAELGLDASAPLPNVDRAPFDDAACALVERLRPPVVSFHFGLPDPELLARVRATGATILSSATSVAEARWLAARGCNAVIAQGAEAGGHRGMFLGTDISTQAGTLALVPQIADAVDVPVIAAGGIADGRGIAAALALGASGAQIGTAYLFTPEATISRLHRRALDEAADNTALTNVFTGRPARSVVNRIMREVGPLAGAAPAFPLAAAALMPLRAATERHDRSDFTSLWSGQAAALGRNMGAAQLTNLLAREALERLESLR